MGGTTGRRRPQPDDQGAGRYRELVESALDHAIFTMDDDGAVMTWSAGAEEVLGWSTEEAVGMSADLTYTPEDRAMGEPEKERILARKEGCAPDVRWHLRKDGSRVFIDGTARAMKDADGRHIGIVKVGQDTTNRRRAEEELRESEAGLRSLKETLETRVAERTAALSDMNRALMEEIREREAAEATRTTLIRLLVSAEEKERGRLSRELHDHMGQQLTGLLLSLRVLERDETDPQRLARVQQLVGLASQLASDLHSVALELRPPALDNLGLEKSLRSHLEEWSQRHGITSDFHAAGLGSPRLTSEIETTIYRIVQEGLTNVLKHASATRVSLVIEQRRGIVRAILEDNGTGFPSDVEFPSDPHRLGLRGIRERLELLGGRMEIESSPGVGTTLFASIPLPTTAGPESGS